MRLDEVLKYIEGADARDIRMISQAIALRQAKLARGKTTTASVYRPVEGHPTNRPISPVERPEEE